MPTKRSEDERPAGFYRAWRGLSFNEALSRSVALAEEMGYTDIAVNERLTRVGGDLDKNDSGEDYVFIALRGRKERAPKSS